MARGTARKIHGLRVYDVASYEIEAGSLPAWYRLDSCVYLLIGIIRIIVFTLISVPKVCVVFVFIQWPIVAFNLLFDI